MKEAAEEGKNNAIERWSFHVGVPGIAVIVDGGWSKRSHKHSYNAKSGAAIIIGAHIGKLLHIGIRNKYCSVCAQTNKCNEEPRQHDCYKNWDGPSSSMETDILVRGFKEAETKYGLCYTRFTGDGDSLVHANLVTPVPGWGHTIRKVECTSHAVKCYRGALEKLVAEKPHYKGKRKLTVAMRKHLTTAARCAIKMRSTGSDVKRATELLQEDLSNGPLHCFGIHTTVVQTIVRLHVVHRHHADTTNILIPEHASSRGEESTSGTNEDESINTVAAQEEQFWRDAITEEELDAVRSVALQLPANVDSVFIWDIQRLVGRLIAKADKLIGEGVNMYMYNYRYMYIV